MLIKQLNSFSEFGIFTSDPIPKGTLLFNHHEWVEDEQFGWTVLSTDDLLKLTPYERDAFLRYSFDIDFNRIIGTFNWECALHISNYMNHSCDPNMMYDTQDNIIARKDIKSGEELTIDYGTFIVNVDQDFICSCNSPQCRGKINRDDWKTLVREYGFHFPTFMHREIRKLIMNKSA